MTAGDESIINTVVKETRETNAKLIELKQWKIMGVYEEVEDNGQKYLSLRWVLRDKIDTEGNLTCKARLCVRGFEEEPTFRTDSPTCSREGLRLFITTAVSKNWSIKSMDVKGAFLQGKELDRKVDIKPPKEAATKMLWRLKKCAYGLADAPRRWFLRIREELIALGATPSSFDNGVYLFLSNNNLEGIVILYVDDILYAGSEAVQNAARQLKVVFQISHEETDSLNYIWLHLTPSIDGLVRVDQNSYIESIPLLSVACKNPHQKLTKDEITLLRGALGRLNWVANMTRPEIAFTVSKISSRIKDATISDMKEANKAIKQIKSSTSHITFPPLDLKSARVVVYSDSSYNNLEDGSSQGGHIVFLQDKHN